MQLLSHADDHKTKTKMLTQIGCINDSIESFYDLLKKLSEEMRETRETSEIVSTAMKEA